MANWPWFVMLVLALVYLPMLFPDGRLSSRRWLPVAVVGGIGASGIALFGAVASVVFRLRRSRGVERRQLEWFAYVTVLFFGGAALTGVAHDASGVAWLGAVSYVLSMVGLVCLPVTVGTAVLKYRLYDIDLLINRTLVYGSLTVMLLLVYFGGVTATQALFRTLTGQQQQPQLAVVVSTLSIAALFNPLRRRLQAFIDRRFSGASTTSGRRSKSSPSSFGTRRT